jgi:DMSO/TMAO reductase YedYZ molybdopterin-dependent catalytic subunit
VIRTRLAAFLAVLFVVAACTSGGSSTSSSAPASSAASGAALTLVAADGSKQALGLPDLEAMPATSGQAGFKSSTGTIGGIGQYTGVAFKDLVTKLPAFDQSMGLNVTASDGYAITYGYDQVMSGAGFTEYDPGTGAELKSPLHVTMILAYEKDGEPLDPATDGSLRVMVVSDQPTQVVDGHWTTKFVTTVEAKPLAKAWTLHLQGAITLDIDRATFESGAAPNCHAKTWTDDQGQVWTGIPLWLLVGRVDDADSHEGAAYNDALASAGYTVDVVAGDGTTVTFDSRRIKRDDNIIVAHLVSGNPLPDKYFPLRLVGSDLTQKEMLGQIVTIVVHVPAIVSPSAVPTSPAQAAASGIEAAGPVKITGLVANPLTLGDADLRAMDLATFTAQTKNGPQDFQGIHLNALLDTAGLKPEAKKLVITATDGYTAEVFLAEVRSCPNALLAVGDSPGHWMTLFPDLPADTWVKNVATIDVQ